MAYEGYVDAASQRRIAGWVWNEASPEAALELEVLARGTVIATIRADVFRADLAAAGKGDGRHAFEYLHEGEPAWHEPLDVRIAGKGLALQPTAAASKRIPPAHQDPRRKLQHTLDFGHPRLATAFVEAAASPDEGAIVERLIAAYERALRDHPAPASAARRTDAWSGIEAAHHAEALALLRARDVTGLAAYLRDAHARGITWGITQGADVTANLRANEAERRRVATQFADYLVSLCEWLGLLAVESPDGAGPWGENVQSDPQALADALAAHLGYAIETPPVMGSYFGIATRGGVITGRDLCALYAALRLRDLARDLRLARPAVCEIGGGLGGVAYYGALLGMDFTIVDLPLVGVLQGYFLARALAPGSLQLYGETASPAHRVRLVPTYAFFEPGREYDILLNQDSFPEMHPEYSLAYLHRADTNVKHAFLSINQEARAPQSPEALQTTVPDLMRAAGTGFVRTSRHRHWLRAGYVDEIHRRKGSRRGV